MDTLLRILVDEYERTTKEHTRAVLRIKAIQRGADTRDKRDSSPNGKLPDDDSLTQVEVLSKYEEMADTYKRMFAKDIVHELKAHYPFYPILKAIKGVGPILAAKLLSMIDITRPNSISALWRHSGYGMSKHWLAKNDSGEWKVVSPYDGYQWREKGGKKEQVYAIAESKPDWVLHDERDRAIEGWVLRYNKRLKTALYLLGTSFIKARAPYRAIYDEWKERYYHTHPEWTSCSTCKCPVLECADRELHSKPPFRTATKGWKTGHADMAARRKMIRMFLSHMWLRWREFEGLPTSKPYAIEHMGHTDYKPPEMFDWPALDAKPDVDLEADLEAELLAAIMGAPLEVEEEILV